MKREWSWTPENTTNEPMDPLWAIVERLEALVGIMDDISDVGDVVANHLTFGGQPVGDMTSHPQNWQCQKTKECTLFNGHQGACIRPYDNAVTVKLCESIHKATGEQCALLAGHDGIHVDTKPVVVGGVKFKPVIPSCVCQCSTPAFMGMGDNLCSKCGYPKEGTNAEK